MSPLLSVILPVLDEEAELPRALDRLRPAGGEIEVLVVDGGSSDGTVLTAERHPSNPRVLSPALPGRAAQLNAAAAEARGETLLFLHADTILPADAFAAIELALSDPSVVGGNFSLRFDGTDLFSRGLGSLYAALRRAGVYYGDSAIFVRADVFARLGGFRPLAVMDDYDFVRRLERAGRTACLSGPAVTSARRWKRRGVARTVASWLVIQTLFAAGVPAERLARLYRPAR